MDGQFAMPGDSGSLVLLKDGSPLGLLVAVDQISGETFVCKASNIEKILEVRFKPPVLMDFDSLQFDPSVFPQDARDRFEVLISGISVGHRDVEAGTLGTFVWDAKTGELLALTCAHIAAPKGAKVGDPIYQPGPFDIRTRFKREPTEEDIAGYLVRWKEISPSHPNQIDAAVFRPTRPVWPNYILGIGERPLRDPK